MKEKGKIIKYGEKGYGWIYSNGGNIFFHITKAQNIKTILNKVLIDPDFHPLIWFEKEYNNDKNRFEVSNFYKNEDISFEEILEFKYSKISRINGSQYLKELINLIVDMKIKNFKTSKDLSLYIKNNNLIINYPRIIGVVDMINSNKEEFLFPCGLSPEIYKIVCEELNLTNLNSEWKVTKHTPYLNN